MRIGIVGSGVYGACIAYFLERFGGDTHDVTVFDRDNVGGVSTARSAGIVRHHYSHEHQIRMAKRGRELLEDLNSLVGQDGGFTRNGYLIMAGEDNERQLRHNVRLQERVGLDVDLLAPEEIPGYVPGVDPEGVAIGAIEHEAGFADPYQVTLGFADAARERGTTVETGVAVTDVTTDNGTVTGVDTPEGHRALDYLVNAAGPWGGEVAAMAGVEVPLTIYEAKLVVLTASEPYGPDRPTTSDVDLGIYAKPEPGGDFIAGGLEREDGHTPLNDPGDLEGVTNEDLLLLGDLIDRRYPGYTDAEVVNAWSGVITASPDWHQVVGVPRGVENFYNALAPGGHGFKEAPAFAEAIAGEILGETPEHDLSPYRLERFENGGSFGDGYGVGSRA